MKNIYLIKLVENMFWRKKTDENKTKLKKLCAILY